MKCKKKRTVKLRCDQIQRQGEKLKIIKIQQQQQQRTIREREANLRSKKKPLWFWLISQSYSFSCEAQMLHLWITIKREHIGMSNQAFQIRNEILRKNKFPHSYYIILVAVAIQVADETHSVALLFRINFQSSRHGDHFN